MKDARDKRERERKGVWVMSHGVPSRSMCGSSNLESGRLSNQGSEECVDAILGLGRMGFLRLGFVVSGGSSFD